LSQLFIEAFTQSRLDLKTKYAKIALDNYIIHITCLSISGFIIMYDTKISKA